MAKKLDQGEDWDCWLAVMDAITDELKYQDALPRRTDDEAKDVPGFLTLARVYMRRCEDNWANNPGMMQPDGQVQVEEALHDLRKLAAIFVRAMIYNGVRRRVEDGMNNERETMNNERPYPDGLAWDEAWRQRQRVEKLEAALRQIAESKYCAYENTSCDQYGIGVTDGHRYCANIAQEALAN